MDLVLVLSIITIAILLFLAIPIIMNTRDIGSLQGRVGAMEDLTRDKLGVINDNIDSKLTALYRGIGEMHSIAASVGDLKKILSNVKIRGLWGEVQLGRILEQMLTPAQFRRNVSVRLNSREQVDYAICIPTGEGDEEGEVLLPIDSKFPMEDYERLVKASEDGDAELVESFSKELEKRIINEAKSISEKYVNPPVTTDYALLFLPTEGLYAEIIRRPGLASNIQQKYRVIVTGPVTVSALINSLQMSFRSYALQKNAKEVWQVLGQVKAEFSKHGALVEKVRKKLQEANDGMEELEKRSRILASKIKIAEGQETFTEE